MLQDECSVSVELKKIILHLCLYLCGFNSPFPLEGYKGATIFIRLLGKGMKIQCNRVRKRRKPAIGGQNFDQKRSDVRWLGMKFFAGRPTTKKLEGIISLSRRMNAFISIRTHRLLKGDRSCPIRQRGTLSRGASISLQRKWITFGSGLLVKEAWPDRLRMGKYFIRKLQNDPG